MHWAIVAPQTGEDIHCNSSGINIGGYVLSDINFTD